MTGLHVERIDSEPALLALEPEWHALERVSGNGLPFHTFIWASCWWRHLRQSRAALKDSLAMRAVRSRDGALVGIAPLLLTERPGVGPLRARCLQFIGADPNVTEIRGALFEPSFETRGYAALHEELIRSAPEVDWFRWTGVTEAGAEALDRCGTGLSWRESSVDSLIDLPATWDELRSTRSRNLKESLRKGYHSLEREGLPYRLEVVASAGLLPALEDFFRLHAARAELRGTIHHNDVFANEARRRFLIDASQRFAERGELRIFRLSVGDALAATRVGFVLGGSLYLYYSGFDPALARFGVMTTALAEIFKWAIGEKLASVNLSTGRDASKDRWRPREVSFRNATWVSPRSLGRAKYEAMEAAERAIRRSPVQAYVQRLLARQAT